MVVFSTEPAVGRVVMLPIVGHKGKSQLNLKRFKMSSRY